MKGEKEDMEVREIKTLDDIVLAYKKGQPLIYKDHKLRRILGFVEGTNEILLKHPCKDTPLCMDFETVKRNYKIVVSNKEENKMEGYIERMIQEHKQLVVRINKLHNFVYGGAYEQVDAIEFGNLCVQLRAMKVYEDALRARLYNAGIKVVGEEYLVCIDTIREEEDNDEKENQANND